MSYTTAHTQLLKIGKFRNQDEDQEVWTLANDPRYHFLIVGFDGGRRVRYVTVLANPQGEPVDYSAIADVHGATRSGDPGNLQFTWKARDPKMRGEYLVIAKGSDPHRLLSYSVKRVGVKNGDPDEEKSAKSRKPRIEARPSSNTVSWPMLPAAR